MGKESNNFLPYSAIVNTGAIYNFVSQAVADSVKMRLAKARRQKRAIVKQPIIATVNGKLLCTTAVVRHMVRMHNSAGIKRCHRIHFIVTDVVGYNVILGKAWLQNKNLDICWDTGIWHWHTRTEAENRPLRLVSASAFVAVGLKEHTQAYKLHLTDFLPEIHHALAGDVLKAIEP